MWKSTEKIKSIHTRSPKGHVQSLNAVNPSLFDLFKSNQILGGNALK